MGFLTSNFHKTLLSANGMRFPQPFLEEKVVAALELARLHANEKPDLQLFFNLYYGKKTTKYGRKPALGALIFPLDFCALVGLNLGHCKG
jgi:hypothetical protein